jgi:hypothetical protein
MLITNEIKKKIVVAMLQARKNFDSDAKHARALEINAAQYTRIKNGEMDKILSDMKWISLARKMAVTIGSDIAWATAKTPVFEYISLQLSVCQADSTTGIFVDKADIGKTHTAKLYVRSNRNAVYVDCSLVKSKQKLVRFIAKEFGLDSYGKYTEVFEDLTFYLKSIDCPLVILDEAGDLDYAAWLELKALWNATENHCGWYMMGADGLRAKIDRGISNKKVGFTEIFSRYGARYNHVTPNGTEERRQFEYDQASLIVRANLPGHSADINKIITKADGSLRRIRKEISKLKKAS